MRKRWTMIRNLIVGVSEIGGFLLWLQFPVAVPIHCSFFPIPDAWGNKFLLLIGFVLPLFAFFPGELPELHSDCEESRQMLEKAKLDSARMQVLYAVIESALFWMIMGTVAYYVL